MDVSDAVLAPDVGGLEIESDAHDERGATAMSECRGATDPPQPRAA